MRRLLLWLAAGLIMLGTCLSGAGIAAAQDDQGPDVDDRSNWDAAYEECITREYERSAVTERVKNEGVTLPDDLDKKDHGLKSGWSTETIEYVREQDPERFQEIIDHYKNDTGAGSRLGRLANRSDCTIQQPVDATARAVSNSEFWGKPIGELTKAVMEGNAEAMTHMMTFWMEVPSSGPGDSDPGRTIEGVKNIAYSVAGIGLVASFIVGGARMVSSRRSGVQDGIEDQGEVLFKWVIFSVGIPAFAPGAIIASDKVAEAIMENFGATDPNTFVEMTKLSESAAGPIVMLILAGLCLAGSVMQLVALVTRVLVFPIVVGLMPAFAAFSFSERGKQGLEHLVAYGIAIILFKPVSAILYSVVTWNATSGNGDDLLVAGTNALMVALAGFTAPALMKALVPAVAQAGGGSGAGIATAGTGALGAAAGAVGGTAGMVAGNKVAKGAASAAGSSAGGGAGGGSSTGTGAGPGSPRGGGGGGGAGGGTGGGAASGPTGPAGSQGGGGHGSTPTRSGGAAPAAGSRSGGSGNRGRVGRALAGMGTASRVGASGLAGASRGVASVARAAGGGARNVGGILDDSIGVQGSYAGQVHR